MFGGLWTNILVPGKKAYSGKHIMKRRDFIQYCLLASTQLTITGCNSTGSSQDYTEETETLEPEAKNDYIATGLAIENTIDVTTVFIDNTVVTI